MKPIYLESSAVINWLFGESHGSEIKAFFKKAESVHVSMLTLLETERVLCRAQTLKTISEKDYRHLKGIWRKTMSLWAVTPLTDAVQKRVGEIFPLEPIRTLDAIHLATALKLSEDFPTLQLISLDKRIIQNAQALGLPVAFTDLQ